MKDKDKVQKLIDELKTLADNDFERHRIDVLEKDLTEPPKVEVIDDKHQKFDGFIYHVVKSNNHYFYQGSIHRAVYSYYFGDIPEGYDIHHIDENPANNLIENLCLLDNASHAKIHSTLDKHKEYICQICGKKFYKRIGKRLFCSRECLAISRKNKYYETRACVICGKEFEAYKHSTQKCCSRSCGVKSRNQTVKKSKN